MSLEDAYLDARPDQDEMEDAINQFLKGFKDMASMLSQFSRSFACTDTLRTTGKTGISRDIPG